MKALLLASALVAGLSGPAAAANDYTTGQRLFALGDYRGAFSSWWPLADKGDARAQFGLALLYEKGNFVEQDLSLAKYWAKLAAKQDYQPAQKWLERAGLPKASQRRTTAKADSKAVPLPKPAPRRTIEDPDTAPNETERLRRLIIQALEEGNDDGRGKQISYGPVDVRETGTGSYTFSIADIDLQRASGSRLTLGRVTGTVKDRGERFREITLRFPGEFEFVDNRGRPGTVHLGGQNIKLTWDNSLNAFPVFDIGLRDLSLTIKGSREPQFRIGELQLRSQLKQQGERWTGPGDLTLTNVAIPFEGGPTIDLANVGLTLYVADLDLVRLLTLRGQRPGKQAGKTRSGDNFQRFLGLLSQLDVALQIEGLTAAFSGEGRFELRHASYGAKFSNLEKENFDLRIDFGHSGLTGTGTQAPNQLVPEQMRLLVDFERLPFEALARVGLAAGLQAFLLGGIQDGGRMVKQLADAAVAADFALTVRQAFFKAPVLAGRMEGGFKADANSALGLTGSLRSQIDGLAQAMASLRASPRKNAGKPKTSIALMPLAMLFAMGEASADGKSHSYHLELRPDGIVFLNGKAMTAGQEAGASPRPK